MGAKVADAITRYKRVTKIEEDTQRNLAGVKRKIISDLNADQIQELALEIYAEVGPIGYDTVLPVVKRG
jgi:hypothetical protein